MSDVKRFRDRATECRNLASGARMDVDRSFLENLASELDAEADKIEAEEAPKGQSTDDLPAAIEDSTD